MQLLWVVRLVIPVSTQFGSGWESYNSGVVITFALEEWGSRQTVAVTLVDGSDWAEAIQAIQVAA